MIKKTSKPTRLTIGFFFAYTDSYNYSLWKGVAEKAQECDLNLISFCGRALQDPRGYESQNNIIYSLCSNQRFDGLILPFSAIGSFISKKAFIDFYQRYTSLPLICTGDILPEIPSILVDNKKGMTKLITHLIVDHGRHRLVFIQGPEQHPEAIIRFQVFQEVLAKNQIPVDPELVIPGLFRHESGALAVDKLLNRPEIKFDAIVAANDDMAWGAIKTLQKRGIRVPEEVAVVGFDDTPESQVIVPPLSTVRQPMAEMGHLSVELLSRLMRGEKIPLQTTLHTVPILRESCGCLSRCLSQGKTEKVPSQKTVSMNIKKGQSCLLESMKNRMKEHFHGLSENPQVKLDYTQVEKLVDAFFSDLPNNSNKSFITTFTNILRKNIIDGEDIQTWQVVLTHLYDKILPQLSDPTSMYYAKELWRQGETLLGEMVGQAQNHKFIQLEEQTRLIRELSRTLVSSFDINELLNNLENWLPLLRIPSFYMAIYEKPGDKVALQEAPPWSRIYLAYYQGKRLAINAEEKLFPSHQIVPVQFCFGESRFAWLAMPLFFKENQIGFIVIETGPSNTYVYEVLRGELSSVLQGSLLLEEIGMHRDHLEKLVIERSDKLVEERYLLRTLIDNSLDCIYIKDLQCCFLLANKATQKVMGVASQDQLIGKTDFDFYSYELAIRFSKDDRMVINTGNPIINQEEQVINHKTGEAVWYLTTKVPLQDNQGNITGLIGIGKDISERKEAERALQQFNIKLEQQVEERTSQLKKTQEDLINVAHKAGMAEISAEVIHDLGNSLNSILVTLRAIQGSLRESNIRFLAKINELLKQHKSNLGDYLNTDKKGRRIPIMLKQIEEVLSVQENDLINGTDVLSEKLTAMNKTLSEYEQYTGEQFISEKVDLVTLVKEIVDQNFSPSLKSQIEISQKNAIPLVTLQKFKFIRAIVILLTNANEALLDREDREKKIGIEISFLENNLVQIIIADNGEGIESENLRKIFNYGFTTKQKNSGCGLHICANSLISMNGRIKAESEGKGKGASFTITLPANK